MLGVEVRQVGPRWQATIGSRVAPVRVYRDSVSFELPAAADFRGRIAARRVFATAERTIRQRLFGNVVVGNRLAVGREQENVEPR